MIWGLIQYLYLHTKPDLQLHSVGHVNHSAIYLTMIFGTCFGALIALCRKSKDNYKIFFLFAYCLLLYISLMLSQSRAAFGMATILGFLFLSIMPFMIKTKNFSMIAFAIIIAVTLSFNPAIFEKQKELQRPNDLLSRRDLVWNVPIEASRFYPNLRSLVIIRPTVVFGEKNRGNVFNLFKQVASGRFVMIGNGRNRKSMAYVENVASFIEFSMKSKPGIFIYNYIDKPDFSMQSLIELIETILGKTRHFKLSIPYLLGLLIGYGFDFFALILRKKLTISSIRIKKFCSNSVYSSNFESTGFTPPVPMSTAIKKTIEYEFINTNNSNEVFYTE